MYLLKIQVYQEYHGFSTSGRIRIHHSNSRKIGCYFIVIKIKEKRRCQFKNNISSYCRSSPSSGQDSNWLVLKVHSGINVLKGLVVCGTAQWNNDRYIEFDRFLFVYTRKLAVKIPYFKYHMIKLKTDQDHETIKLNTPN